MSIKIRSQMSIAAVNVSGKSGKLRVILSDATMTSISINIDGTGAVVYTAANFDMADSNIFQAGGSGAPVFGVGVPHTLLTDGGGRNQHDFNLEFSTSLAITVTGGNYWIMWDEDVF